MPKFYPGDQVEVRQGAAPAQRGVIQAQVGYITYQVLLGEGPHYEDVRQDRMTLVRRNPPSKVS